MSRVPATLLVAMLVAACNGASPPAADNAVATINAADTTDPVVPADADADAMGNEVDTADAPVDVEKYAGRWVGVEGMVLTVATAGGDRVSLDMQYDLDHRQKTTGTVTPDGISFTRDGQPMVLKPGDGDATGLKYLAGKTDCLIVKSGEAYCRA